MLSTLFPSSSHGSSKQSCSSNIFDPTAECSNAEERHCCFYKSDCDPKLQYCDIQNSFPNGQEVTEIASKESLYIVEGVSIQLNW